MTIHRVTLAGLDGANPLAFMAALGTLRVLADHAQDQVVPRLSWREEGRWRPVLHGVQSVEQVIDLVCQDLTSWPGDPVLNFSYQVKRKGGTSQVVRDLKPGKGKFRSFLDLCAQVAADGNSRPAQFAAAYATDVAVDRQGNTKPTDFHFTAGKQLFLDMVRQLAEGVTAEDFQEALMGPWRGTSKLPSLSWDATVSRHYALRASDPSKEKRGSVAGAEWLAFMALPLLPTAPRGSRIQTTCCHGRWKSGAMRWPLWTIPATLASVGSLLRNPKLANLDVHQRRARGIGIVFESAIRRTGQGGYGSFSPAKVV